MQAIVRDGYGGPEQVRLAEVDLPVAGDGEVLVRVTAASVNAADLDVLRGRPAFARVVNRLVHDHSDVVLRCHVENVAMMLRG